MSEAPETIWARRECAEAGDKWLQCHLGHDTLKVDSDIPYRRADTVVSRDVADKMAEALRNASADPAWDHQADEALAAYEGENQ